MMFRGGFRKTAPKYMFQGIFLTTPRAHPTKSQENFTFGGYVLKTIAKSSIFMTFGGGIGRNTPKYIFQVCSQYPSS